MTGHAARLPLPESIRLLRQQTIEAAIAEGRIARFHYHKDGKHLFYKDVNEFAPDEYGDLVSFRRSGGPTEFVCWDSPFLSIEFIESDL